MSPVMRKAKLAKLIELEGFEDENELFAAAMSDSVCPAICCNPDAPDCDYTEEKEPDSREGWCEVDPQKSQFSPDDQTGLSRPPVRIGAEPAPDLCRRAPRA